MASVRLWYYLLSGSWEKVQRNAGAGERVSDGEYGE